MPASTTASPPKPARIWKKIGDLAVTTLMLGAVADAQQKR